jgi:hypothetical protein
MRKTGGSTRGTRDTCTIQPDREGGHHLEARQGDLHKQVLSAQNRMFDAERHTLETEAEVRRWETEIENMRQRMMEDGLVLDADGSVRPERASPPPVEVPYWLAAEGDRVRRRPAPRLESAD